MKKRCAFHEKAIHRSRKGDKQVMKRAISVVYLGVYRGVYAPLSYPLGGGLSYPPLPYPRTLGYISTPSAAGAAARGGHRGSRRHGFAPRVSPPRVCASASQRPRQRPRQDKLVGERGPQQKNRNFLTFLTFPNSKMEIKPIF